MSFEIWDNGNLEVVDEGVSVRFGMLRDSGGVFISPQSEFEGPIIEV